jgi:hypothetical protein
MRWSNDNDHFVRSVMHASHGAHKVCLGSGHSQGWTLEKVHAYLWLLEFDGAVCSDITHRLEVM